MSSRAGRHARRRRNNTVAWGVAIFALVLAVVAALVWMRLTAEPALDKLTLCPATGPTGHHVLLVDKTDPLNFTQKQAFLRALDDLIEKRTPPGYLLSVFVIGETIAPNAEPLMELCNPGTGSDKSALTANLKKLRQRYERSFAAPMRSQADALQASTPARYSPILEMLQQVSIKALRRHDVKGERRLIILSDMLHNMPQFSMFGRSPDYDYASFAASAYGKKSQTDLHAVDVELLYLLHAPRLQTRGNLLFWEQHFKNCGARVVAVQPLEG